VKIYIAGVYHFDPFGRTYLQKWLKELDVQHNTRPDFIAVEWDKDIFSKIKNQRGEFYKLAHKEWPNASNDMLNVLKDSLGYEGDSHVNIFPDIEVLWLDGGRKGDHTDIISINSYATVRLNKYRGLLGLNTPLELSILNKKVLEGVNSNSSLSDERDTKFSELILKKVQGKDGWAIVIVGANHARNETGRMRRILEDNKLICEVTILR